MPLTDYSLGFVSEVSNGLLQSNQVTTWDADQNLKLTTIDSTKKVVTDRAFSVTATTASTSSTTGALIVAGGAGFAGSVNVAGALSVTATTASTSSTTGALIVSGGAGVGNSMYVNGNVYVVDTNANVTKLDPYKEVSVSIPLTTGCVDQCVFISDMNYNVVGAREIHATAGTDAGAVSLDIVKTSGTDAPGVGNTVITSTFDLKGTANTIQTKDASATAADIHLTTGDRLSLNFTGTTTSLAGVLVTVMLKPA